MLISRTIAKRVLATVGLVSAVGVAVAFLVPRPIEVDVASVTRGPLLITVDEDGKTRVKERYVVSAPLGGRLSRIRLRAGDPVTADETLLAEIKPTDPQLLDARATAEAEARVNAAAASHRRADAELGRARAAQELATHRYERASRLISSNAISREELDSAEHAARQASEELRAAEFGVKVADFELQLAQAALIRTQPSTSAEHELTTLPIRSPINGQVLRILQESDRVVTPGTELMEIGDLAALEAQVDVLSSDAATIAEGADAWFEHWGGARPLKGRVRRVEPSGFTKVSALGVEEQRVNVLIDFVDPAEDRPTLGDGFRVDAKILVWKGDPVLKVASGALFRSEGKWSAFVYQDGRARLREVDVGHNNGVEAEVFSGLHEGDVVILYPSDRIVDQRRIRPRRPGIGNSKQ